MSCERIPLSEPWITQDDIRAVQETLCAGWVSTSAPVVAEFEEAFADHVGKRYAVACVNGTAALWLACKIRKPTHVLTNTMSFIAPAEQLVATGHTPVLADVNPAGVGTPWCQAGLGRVVVHLLGYHHRIPSGDLWTVEDCSQLVDLRNHGKSEVLVYSLNGNKALTAGGGGMLCTDNEQLAAEVRSLANHCRIGPEYTHGGVGSNLRMPGINAALGWSQLRRANAILEAKRQIAETYRDLLRDLPGVGEVFPSSAGVPWLYTITVEGGSRPLQRRLAALGIESRPLYRPVHRQPSYSAFRAHTSGLADRLYEEGLSLPSSVTLTYTQARRVCQAIEEFQCRK